MSLDLDGTARKLLSCICDALADAERPVCSCYATIGPPVIGANCCECEKGSTGEATVHFEQMYDADPSSLQQVNRIHPCRQSTLAADLTVVVTRCYPTLDESGQFPDTHVVDEVTGEMHADVSTVYQALVCCVETRMLIRSVAVDSMPEAGCSALAARVTVEVKGVGSS